MAVRVGRPLRRFIPPAVHTIPAWDEDAEIDRHLQARCGGSRTALALDHPDCILMDAPEPVTSFLEAAFCQRGFPFSSDERDPSLRPRWHSRPHQRRAPVEARAEP